MSDDIPPIGTRLSQLAAEAPDRPVVSADGRTITRAELESASNRLARAYAELGVKQGDYVTIAVPNSIEWVLATVAVWKLGAIPQPLSPRLPDAEFEGLLDLVPRALLVGRADPRGVVPSVDADFTGSPELSDAPLPEAVSPVWKSMASGGSTGRPKLIEAGGDGRIPADLLAMSMGNEPTDTQLLPVPLSHNTGFTSAAIALLTGQHLVLMRRFDPEHFLRLVTDYRVNYLATVPTILQRLLPVYHANPDAYDLSSLRRLWHLAAPCPPNIKEAWIELLGPDAVWELYGGTELQALTFISGSEWLTHRGSVGRVVAGEMKVLDDDGNECPPGVLGEIYMRPSPGLARPPTATSAAPPSPATAGTRWAIWAGSTTRATCTWPTGGSTCSPSAGATCTRPRSRTRSPSTPPCCPVWWSGCRMKTSARCHMRWCTPTVPRSAQMRWRRSWRSGYPTTRCRAAWNSSTPRCATMPARPADPRCATRSSPGCRLRPPGCHCTIRRRSVRRRLIARCRE